MFHIRRNPFIKPTIENKTKNVGCMQFITCYIWKNVFRSSELFKLYSACFNKIHGWTNMKIEQIVLLFLLLIHFLYLMYQGDSYLVVKPHISRFFWTNPKTNFGRISKSRKIWAIVVATVVAASQLIYLWITLYIYILV